MIWHEVTNTYSVARPTICCLSSDGRNSKCTALPKAETCWTTCLRRLPAIVMLGAWINRPLRYLVVALWMLPAPSIAEEWTIDHRASRLWFEVSAEVPNGDDQIQLIGVFHDWSATINFDPAHPEAAWIEVEVDLASVRTGDAFYDQELRSPAWLGIRGNPKAVFRAQNFAELGGKGYLTFGALTLRGQTHPLELRFELTKSGQNTRANGGTTVARLEFGVGANAGPGLASADVAVHFSVLAKPVASAVVPGTALSDTQ